MKTVKLTDNTLIFGKVYLKEKGIDVYMGAEGSLPIKSSEDIDSLKIILSDGLEGYISVIKESNKKFRNSDFYIHYYISEEEE